MTLLISWLAFPLVLGLMALGCGLLLERVSATRLPGALLLPAGLAVIVVVGLFPIMSDTTADITTPTLVVLAAAGLVLSPPWRRGPPDFWAAASACAVFAAYAAPIVLSGEATFAGYYTQTDTGTWFGLTDRIMEHGRSLSGLPASTYRQTLGYYLPTGYPLGAFVPLGAGRELVGTDPAWLFQPYLAFIAAMLSLSLYCISARLLPSRRLRLLAVFVASQPAILFGFSLWAGIKELAGAWVLALLAALASFVVEQGARGRALLSLSVAAAAALGLLSFAGAIWLVPLLALALVLAIRLRGRETALNQAGVFVILAVVLSIPSLTVAGTFWSDATGNVITGHDEGLLLPSLSLRQLFGIWPAGDFRTTPVQIGVTDALIAVVVIAAVGGLVWAWRRGTWELPLYGLGAGIACLIVTAAGSPWVDSKALAIASPAVLLTAMVGGLALFGTSRRIGTPAAVAAIAIAGGVMWSNLLAYHDVTLAPRDQESELERIGDRIAGQGPTLLTSFEPYASGHFLGAADVHAPSGFGSLQLPVRGGGVATVLGGSIDIEKYAVDLGYRTLVRPRSPLSSRPPSVYRLVWSGVYYEVWQQITTPEHVLDHLALGTGVQPVGKPRCSDVLALARLAGPTGRLAAAAQPPLTITRLPGTPVWKSGDPQEAVPSARRSGTITGRVRAPVPGLDSVWMSGSFHRRVELLVDGRPVGKRRTERNFDSPFYVFLGRVSLRAGSHAVELRYGDGGALHPGIGGYAALNGVHPAIISDEHSLDFGPLVLTRAEENLPLAYVTSSRARTLCGKTLDWVEALSG